jgi:hypothetical protein
MGQALRSDPKDRVSKDEVGPSVETHRYAVLLRMRPKQRR